MTTLLALIFALFGILPNFGDTGIRQLQQFTGTSSPFVAIAPTVHGKPIYAPFSNATTSSLALINLTNCNTIDTDANGNLLCGTDDGGASAFSTTSASYFASVGLSFSTTTSDYWKDQRNFFSTTSANYWATFGLAFSTTSANNFTAVGLSFSTTSTDYWKTQNTFEALTAGDGLTRTSDDFDCDTASGTVFGCLSAANWTTFNSKESALTFTYPLSRSVNTISLAFGTTTANAWSALQSFSNATSTLHTISTALYLPNAYFNSTKIGLGSTTPSSLWGISIGTSTVMQASQFSMSIASSTTNTALHTVNWDSGNTQRHILQQNTSIVLNSTSSFPRDGAKYVLKLCQGGAGSYTVTFVTPGQLVWLAGGTTTVSSAVNTVTMLGMIYDARTSRYDVVASSTSSDIRSCKP